MVTWCVMVGCALLMGWTLLMGWRLTQRRAAPQRNGSIADYSDVDEEQGRGGKVRWL